MIRTRRLVYHTGDFQLAAPFYKGSKSAGRILKTLRLAAFRVKNIQMGFGNIYTDGMLCHLLHVLCLSCVTETRVSVQAQGEDGG